MALHFQLGEPFALAAEKILGYLHVENAAMGREEMLQRCLGHGLGQTTNGHSQHFGTS
jgi:hypothetical protein